MTKIILASASDRRKDILSQVGISYEVMPSSIDEDAIQADTPAALVEALSAAKAEDIAERLTKNFVIIGADTVVVKDNSILGKPSDEAEAAKMLQMLQGNRHEVYTGVTLISVSPEGKGLIDTFHVRTIVDMIPMTAAQIDAYIKTGEPMDKAGAYGIQGRGAAYIQDIAGDYYNVVGLPISTVLARLANMGIDLY
ncbi:MAG: septum formation protein Maf [Clostridium sp. 44_14]|jgi:septum formation protein|nr:MAG: septum formation protein Maf [Clostridium sp. 44_14]RHU95544.1 septum formation inhibitor Maf [Clostridium sp. OM07-9AC]RHV08226.1 septum formation inhibitor Maf [Clostridium sp. OM07-10AC]